MKPRREERSDEDRSREIENTIREATRSPFWDPRSGRRVPPYPTLEEIDIYGWREEER